MVQRNPHPHASTLNLPSFSRETSGRQARVSVGALHWPYAEASAIEVAKSFTDFKLFLVHGLGDPLEP